jgi:serine/threonine protein kinase
MNHDSPVPPVDVDYARRKELFLELFALDPARRAQRLAELANESGALADELAQQLRASEQPLSALDQADRRERSREAGPQIAGYRVLQRLGRGGMGEVWLAEREIDGALQRVALKQLAHSAWGSEDRRRFERERRILAGLEHPGIAGLLDGGRDAEGAPYLALQYVEGLPLDQWCAQAAPDLRTRVRVLREVADAVAYAHARLVVHRDLKPSNVMVDGFGRARLLDFGIAHLQGEGTLTAGAHSLMTLRYAAPEQIDARPEAASVSVDVHALGLLLYELIAGRSPFADLRDSAALIHAVLQVDPTPPSRIIGAQRGADADLDAICLRALRKRPDARYPSADALVAELDRWLAGQAVEARRGEFGYAFRRLLKRRWPLLAAAAAALLLMAGGASLHVLRMQQELARTAAERDRAEALSQHLIDLFGSVPPAAVEGGSVSARELLEHHASLLQEDTGKPAATRAALMLANAVALKHLGEYPRVAQIHDEVERLLGTIDTPEPELRAWFHVQRADVFEHLQRRPEAQAQTRAALALIEAGGVHSFDVQATAWGQSAMHAQDAGQLDAARAGYETLAEIALRNLPLEEAKETYVSMQSNISDIEMRTDAPAAERRLREVLRWARENAYADRELLLLIRINLAPIIHRQGRCDEALGMYLGLLPEAREFFGGADPGMGLLLSNMVPIEESCGKPSDAVAHARQSLDIDRRLGGEDALTTAYSRLSLAAALIEDERPGEALAALEPVLTTISEEGPASSIEWLSVAAARRSEAELMPDPARLKALERALQEVPQTARNYLQQARLQRWQGWLQARDQRSGA